MERFIDLSLIPKYIYKGKECYDWNNSKDTFIKFIYDDIEGMLKILDYNKETRKLSVIYNNNKYEINTYHLIEVKLGRILEKYSGEFKLKIGDIVKDDKRNLTVINKEKRGYYKWYQYRCNKCSYINWVTESSLIQRGSGCTGCASKTVILGYNDIFTIAPHLIVYFKDGIKTAKSYTVYSNKKVSTICPDCGQEKRMAINNLYQQGFSCPCCGDKISRPNKFMFNILKELNIDFEYEKQFDWCRYKLRNKNRNGRYDFVFSINQNNYIVEMDGEFHKKEFNKNGNTLNEIQFIDSEKDRLAANNGYKVIRIDCVKRSFEDMQKEILNSELKNILLLKNVNWTLCAENSEKNIVKIVAEYYMSNKPITPLEIADNFKLKRRTISNYLHKGTSLGWCDYVTVYPKRQSKSM